MLVSFLVKEAAINKMKTMINFNTDYVSVNSAFAPNARHNICSSVVNVCATVLSVSTVLIPSQASQVPSSVAR